jgi:hypothetical protein
VHERAFVIGRGGKKLGAIVSLSDLRCLEALEAAEDRQDVEASERAIDEWKRRGEPTVSLSDLRRSLGVQNPHA